MNKPTMQRKSSYAPTSRVTIWEMLDTDGKKAILTAIEIARKKERRKK